VPQAAPLARRLFSLFYEALLLAAVLWLAGFPLAIVETGLDLPHLRPVQQVYLICVAGAYFVVQWTHGGQTLAMKTWRLKLERRDGGAPALRDAVLRYVAALASLAAFGLGFLWAFFDRERLFLHDRIAGTRIVRI
jgi:uncharacterized RDD family membrane protein YckC